MKVILASGQGVVTKETAAALKAFKARGGKIVADANFVPAIKADAAFPTDGEVAAACPGLEAHDAYFDAVGCGLLLLRILALPGWEDVTLRQLTQT